jgi:hypothetical protein
MQPFQRFVKSSATAALLALSLAFVGCASLPSPEKMKEETASFKLPALPAEGKALVYVVRPSSMGTLIRFNVFVNNEKPEAEMGYTRGAQYIYFELNPGSYKLMSKAENLAEVAIEAKAGDVIFVNQEPAMGLLMARNALSTLPDYQGKYHVKTLELGTIRRSRSDATRRSARRAACGPPVRSGARRVQRIARLLRDTPRGGREVVAAAGV